MANLEVVAEDFTVQAKIPQVPPGVPDQIRRHGDPHSPVAIVDLPEMVLGNHAGNLPPLSDPGTCQHHSSREETLPAHKALGHQK